MRLIYDGISIENDSVVYNDVSDAENDIMNIVKPDIYINLNLREIHIILVIDSKTPLVEKKEQQLLSG